MSQITTHILDTSLGKPAASVEVELHQLHDNQWRQIASDETNQDGRVGDWLGDGNLTAGQYRLVFQVGDYFARAGRDTFYPHIEIVFQIGDDGQHYHVPLLLNPYGYSTYRGS